MTFALLGGAPLGAATLHAVVSGGLISGELGGTAFSDASYTVTASYDPAGVQSGTLAGFPATWQTTAGTLEITASTDAAGTFVIVPEPSSMAALGVAIVALGAVRRRPRA